MQLPKRFTKVDNEVGEQEQSYRGKLAAQLFIASVFVKLYLQPIHCYFNL